MAGTGVEDGVGESVEVGVSVGGCVNVAVGIVVTLAAVVAGDLLLPQLAAKMLSKTRQIDKLCFFIFILNS